MSSEVSASPPARRTSAERPDVDGRLFWSWVWASVQPVVGWVLVALGLLAMLLGWWGVAHNSIVAKQLPYLASGAVIGLALVTLGGRFLVMQDLRHDSGRLDRLERMVHELHEVLLAGAAAAAADGTLPEIADDPDRSNGTARSNGGGPSTFLVLPDAESYHRAGCPMIEGKADLSRVRASTVARRNLRPCPMCEPVAAQV